MPERDQPHVTPPAEQQPASVEKQHQPAVNPDPRANENLEPRERQSKASKGVGSEITDGEDA